MIVKANTIVNSHPSHFSNVFTLVQLSLPKAFIPFTSITLRIKISKHTFKILFNHRGFKKTIYLPCLPKT